MTFKNSSSELPHLSIITAHTGPATSDDPLFCTVASVADQEGIKIEHVLQHASAVTGLWGKLSREVGLSKRAENYLLRVLEEKNSEAYEALYSGISRATAPLIGFLQPGEQYLPGVLAAVVAEFEHHPDLDFLFTGTLSLDHAETICFSDLGVVPSQEYLWTSQPTLLSGALFCRASLLREEFAFNPRYEQQTITEWVLRVLQGGKKGKALAITTTLLSTEGKTQEKKEKVALPSAPKLMSLLRPWWEWRHQNQIKQQKKNHPAPQNFARYRKDSLKERVALR